MDRRSFLATASSFVLSVRIDAAVQIKPGPTDPITGTWTGDALQPGTTKRAPLMLRLKLDGTAITGTVTSSQNTFEILGGSFESKSRAVRWEIEMSSNGIAARTVFDGQLTDAVIAGRCMRGEQAGDFKVSRAPEQDRP